MRRQMSKFLLRQEDLQREPVSQSTKLMSNSLCSSKMSNSGHDLARPLIRLTLQDHDLDVTSESQKHIGVASGLPSSSNLRRQTWLVLARFGWLPWPAPKAHRMGFEGFSQSNSGGSQGREGAGDLMKYARPGQDGFPSLGGCGR